MNLFQHGLIKGYNTSGAVFLRRFLFFVFLLAFSGFGSNVSARGQSGRVYEFLSLPSTARITAMGGYAFAGPDADMGMALTYPSLLRPELNGFLSLNFVDYFDDINYGTVAMARHFDRLGTFSASVNYINYGRLIEADETGQIHGEFSAGEYGFMLGWGRPLSPHFYMGANLKSIHSFYHEYQSWGMAVDLSLAYISENGLFAAGLAARQIGSQIKPFTDGNYEKLPFDLVLSASHKLANAPFRLSLVAHNLHRWDLSYRSPISTPQIGLIDTGSPAESNRMGDLADQFMRHIVLGLEFVPSQNFSFKAGYNYRRRQEMKVDTRLSTVGFSWGFGIRISRFHLHYGRSNYHLGGAPNHISITTSLQDLMGRSHAGSPVILTD